MNHAQLSFFLLFFHISLFTMHNLPQEILNHIITFTFPIFTLHGDADTKDEEEKNRSLDIDHLNQIIQNIIVLKLTNQNLNVFIDKNFTQLLCIDKNNKFLFLIRSIQANIPYFIKQGVACNDNRNAFHMDGLTPLLHATKQNNYPACALLLKNGANVNLKWSFPKLWGCGYNPDINYPLDMATKNSDATLVTLFMKAENAHLNFKLLTNAICKNEPTIMAALLADKNETWSITDIENALCLANTSRIQIEYQAQQKSKSIKTLLENKKDFLNTQKNSQST